MQIKILGVGHEDSPELGNPSFIIYEGNKNFLVNCGYLTLANLIKNKLISKVDRLFVSNDESAYSGGTEGLISLRKNLFQKKTKFYALSDHLLYLRSINKNFELKMEDFFILNEKDSIITMPVAYKDGVNSEAFFNYGILYSGPSAESLLDTPQAFESKMIIHDVSFSGTDNNHVDFSVLNRASSEIKKKTWLIGYRKNEEVIHSSKVIGSGFAGFLINNTSFRV